MWVMTTGGFVSAVEDRDDPSRVVVRSRDRDSLQCVVDGTELIAGFEAPEIVLGAGTDYPYRVVVSKEAFARWLAFEVTEYVNYTNFKDAVKVSRGAKWGDVLMDIWAGLLRVTDTEGRDYGPYATAKPRGIGYWADR